MNDCGVRSKVQVEGRRRPDRVSIIPCTASRRGSLRPAPSPGGGCGCPRRAES